MHLHRLHWVQFGITFLLIVSLSACRRSANTLMTPLPSLPPPTATGAPETPPAAADTATPEPLPTADLLLIPGPNVTFEHVQFTLPEGLASAVQAQMAPALMNFGEQYPRYVEFSLVDYNSQNVLSPLIEVYPVDELGEGAGQIVQKLKDLLAEQPATPAPAGELPILPGKNAGQLIDVQIKYLTFSNGSGIRFVTQLGQDAWPIHNAGLVYVFQGLTSDERYYISALLPVTTLVLPDRVDDPAAAPPVDGVSFPDFNSPDFTSEYARYREAIIQKLHATAPQEFAPPLNSLDELVGSMQVGNVAVTPATATLATAIAATATQESASVPCRDAPPTRLRVGLFAYVNPDPPLPNNIRSEAGKDQALTGEALPGQAMEILDGPKCADGWVWWQVRTLETELMGWTAEGDHESYWLVPCASREACAP